MFNFVIKWLILWKAGISRKSALRSARRCCRIVKSALDKGWLGFLSSVNVVLPAIEPKNTEMWTYVFSPYFYDFWPLKIHYVRDIGLLRDFARVREICKTCTFFLKYQCFCSQIWAQPLLNVLDWTTHPCKAFTGLQKCTRFKWRAVTF